MSEHSNQNAVEGGKEIDPELSSRESREVGEMARSKGAPRFAGRRSRKIGRVRILAVGIVAALVLGGLLTYAGDAGFAPFAGRPASDGPSLTLGASSGAAGAPVIVTLAGFPASGQVSVNMTNSSVPGYPVESDPDFYLNASGGADQEFTPAGVHMTAGSYKFSAYDPSTETTVSASYTVTTSDSSAAVAPSPGCGGSSVTASGNGFTPGVPGYIYIGPTAGSLGYTAVSENTVNETGGVSQTFVPPALTAGTYILFIADPYGNYAATSFVCSSATTPTLSLSPASGPMGERVTLTGTGFAPDSPLISNVTPQGGPTYIDCADLKSNSAGSFHCTFTMPGYAGAAFETIPVSDTSGDHVVTVYGVVEPAVTLTPDSAQPGQTVSITATGLAPNSPTTAAFGLSDVACGRDSNSKGEFHCSLVTPYVNAGYDTITIQDSWDNRAPAFFTVLALPTSEYPAYVFSMADGNGPLPGVNLDGTTGLLLNSWQLGVHGGPTFGAQLTTFTASTNLTDDSAALYNLSAACGPYVCTNAALTAFVLGPDPNSTTPGGSLTVVQESGSIIFVGDVLSVEEASGGSGESGTPVIDFTYYSPPPEQNKILGWSVSGHASAVPEPTTVYPAYLATITPNGSDAYNNPISIDGVSGSWVSSWWINTAAPKVEFNVTVQVSLVSLWLSRCHLPADTWTSIVLYEIGGSSGPIELQLTFASAGGTLPFSESATWGGPAEFTQTFVSSTVT